MTSLLNKFVQPYLKAHGGGVIAAVSLLINDILGLKTGQKLSADQWYGIVGAYAATGLGVHQLANTVAAPVVAVSDVAEVLDGVADDGADSEV